MNTYRQQLVLRFYDRIPTKEVIAQWYLWAIQPTGEIVGECLVRTKGVAGAEGFLRVEEQLNPEDTKTVSEIIQRFQKLDPWNTSVCPQHGVIGFGTPSNSKIIYRFSEDHPDISSRSEQFHRLIDLLRPYLRDYYT